MLLSQSNMFNNLGLLLAAAILDSAFAQCVYPEGCTSRNCMRCNVPGYESAPESNFGFMLIALIVIAFVVCWITILLQPWWLKRFSARRDVRPDGKMNTSMQVNNAYFIQH